MVWSNVDRLGSPRLPEGRFVCAETEVAGQIWTLVGMCIPYHAYRTGEKWGPNQLQMPGKAPAAIWMRCATTMLPKLKNRERVVLLGDFNIADSAKELSLPWQQGGSEAATRDLRRLADPNIRHSADLYRSRRHVSRPAVRLPAIHQ